MDQLTTASWRASSSRLVGRGSELERLRQLLAGMESTTTGRAVLIHGEAGVGKSRLVREFAAVARRAGMSVFSGRAVPSGEAYRAFAEALSTALRGRQLPRDGSLRPYLPVLSALLPDIGIDGRSDPRGGVVLGEAILRLTTILAHPSCSMLVLEDLHWADPDTLDVLSYLADAAITSPLILVVTARDELDPPQRLLDVARASQADVVPLNRLSPRDVRGMVESCLSTAPPDELVNFIIEHADGLPLLVEELLTGLAAVGALTPDGTLTGPLTANVPRTFAATVRRRLSGLDRIGRAVVETAAVLGRRFDWQLIPEITGLAEPAVIAGLRSAVATGLIAVDATDGDTFRFRHALTCEAVRADLLPPERRALARAAARVVERREPAARDLAAGLWMAAGHDARAAELYLSAGRQARRSGALHTADVLVSRAADLAADDPELRREAEAVLLEVLADAGDTDRALALGERMLARGDTSVGLTLAELAAEAGRWDMAASRLSALADSNDPRASVLAARLAHERGRPEDARNIARLAFAEAEERQQWSVASHALEVMGRAARVTDLEAARDAFLAAERLAIRHDLPLERVSALHELGTVDLLLEGSTVRLERAQTLAMDAGALGLAAKVDVQIAASLLHLDADAALRHAQRSAELARRLRMEQLQATALFFQAAAHAHSRNTLAMEHCVTEARRLAPDDLDVNAGIWGAVYAHIALLDDDRGRLAECLDRAIEFMRSSPTTAPAPTYGLWALVRTLDDRDGERARAEARPSGVNWENRALLGYADAVDAGRRRRHEEAERLFAAADAAMRSRPWWQHRIRLLLAGDALADGWGDPIGWVREALAVFVLRGDDRLATRCREVLRRAGVPVPRRGRGDTAVPSQLRSVGVTSREMDVLQLVAKGLTNGAIAEELVLSPRTVETHVANLVAKTKVAGRSGLASLVKSGIAAD